MYKTTWSIKFCLRLWAIRGIETLISIEIANGKKGFKGSNVKNNAGTINYHI